jgi:hypothetical protein
MLQQYDFNAPANQSFRINAAGRYIKYASGNNGGGDVSIVATPMGQGANQVVLVPGQALTLPQSVPGWVLSNSAGGATITGKVVIGDGKIDDPTINGTVQVVDGGKQRTMSGSAMMGYAWQAATAGNVSLVQLWNPANSGKNAFLEQLTIFSQGTLAQGIAVRGANAALATFYVNAQAKRIGGAQSTLLLNVGLSASLTGVGFEPTMAIFDKTTKVLRPAEPIQIPPGYGLIIGGGLQNEDLGVGFEYFEEPA